MSKKFEAISKKIPSLHINTTKSDMEEMAANEKFKARIQDWHKGVIKDVQLDETMAIMNDLINYKDLSKK